MKHKIKEFHLFAGIGGGIYGGKLLGHTCCAGVEIDQYCQDVLSQRQKDGWMEKFPIYGDLTKLKGTPFKGTFDILCGGFPCQAFSHAAHGKNISEKNLWGEMLRFVQESDAPIVFGENVTLKALTKAKSDLENIGYKVELCKLSCGDLGADHRRDRYWLLAVKDDDIFQKVAKHVSKLPKLNPKRWTIDPHTIEGLTPENHRRQQLKGIGNAQSPFVVASIFRILTNRHLYHKYSEPIANTAEIEAVYEKRATWIQSKYGKNFGLVHTPTTMANYSAPSMMKHQGCRNFTKIFSKPSPSNAEYLMGFPFGASSLSPMSMENIDNWLN